MPGILSIFLPTSSRLDRASVKGRSASSGFVMEPGRKSKWAQTHARSDLTLPPLPAWAPLLTQRTVHHLSLVSLNSLNRIMVAKGFLSASLDPQCIPRAQWRPKIEAAFFPAFDRGWGSCTAEHVIPVSEHICDLLAHTLDELHVSHGVHQACAGMMSQWWMEHLEYSQPWPMSSLCRPESLELVRV